MAPVVTSTAKPSCEGDRVYYFTYTDCEGNTATWQFRYKVEYLDFTVPASETLTVNCPVNATPPTPPTVLDNCGKLVVPIGPTITGVDSNFGCEASRSYAWTYKDCEGNAHVWSKTYNFAYDADFFPPADEVFEVGCLLYAQPPVPQTLYDFCGQQIAVSGPVVEGDDDGCSGYRKYTFTYTDCGGHSHPWTFTYFASDTEAPVGTCPNVDVTDLGCIDEVPCPDDDYDFSGVIAELLDAGNIYDVCSGTDLTITMDSWTELWECSDLDNDGNYTFGRTFYFRIADACGNEFPSLCGVTYSGKCLPIETFPQNAWGIPGGEPGIAIGSNTTDQQVIAELLGANNPLTIGGANRSLSLTDATCVVNLLPGTSGPGTLANCHQVNCTGCNPLGIGGMKNNLAANAIALHLNLRYNVRYNQLGMNDLRNQRLDCIEFTQSLLYCPPAGGDCVLRIIENPGIAHDFPNTIGGLLDLANLYLNGGLDLTFGQNIFYAQALNSSIGTVNTYWHGRSQTVHCSPNAGIPDNQQTMGGGQPATVGKASTVLDLDLSPNPAGSEVMVRLAGLEEAAEISLEVYNAFGQMVLRKDFGTVGNLNERLDLSGFNDGMYFVSLKAGGERLEQKLVISRD
ncbi:MAG: T9SS type A sorting domain-containing protein [Saprospiraceae bacterium]|nr:T9SS type A sorting domain-containing protein [Saprospiraceae bacterium]